MGLIKNLESSCPVKRFDSTRKITETQLSNLKEAVRLTPSSFGLQPFKVLVFENQGIKNRLLEATYYQLLIAEASHIFVFCANNSVTDSDVENHIRRTAKANGIETGELKELENDIRSKVLPLNKEETIKWAEKQVYMAISNLLVACTEMKLDACLIEGFNSEAYKKMLILEDTTPVAIAAVGYRIIKGNNQHRVKARKSIEELFKTI